MFALAAMLAEHHGEFLSEWLPARLPLYLDYAGRIVAPIFFFLAVESYFKTSNRRRYLARLYAWALFMLVGNLIVAHFVQAAYQPERFFPVGHNIFLSIAVGVSNRRNRNSVTSPRGSSASGRNQTTFRKNSGT